MQKKFLQKKDSNDRIKADLKGSSLKNTNQQSRIIIWLVTL